MNLVNAALYEYHKHPCMLVAFELPCYNDYTVGKPHLCQIVPGARWLLNLLIGGDGQIPRVLKEEIIAKRGGLGINLVDLCHNDTGGKANTIKSFRCKFVWR